jgi:hypothetical protein
MVEKIFVVFHRSLFGNLCLFDGMSDRAAAADAGMKGIMLILLVAASIVSSLRPFVSLLDSLLQKMAQGGYRRCIVDFSIESHLRRIIAVKILQLAVEKKSNSSPKI